MLEMISIEHPNSFVILGSIRALIAKEFMGVCIESNGFIHKLSHLDTSHKLRQLTEQEAYGLARKTWGEKILRQTRILSHQNKRWPSSFSKLEIIIKDQAGKVAFILVLVFRKSEYKIDEIFQELRKGIDLFVKNQDKWIDTILFHGN
ncbi:MAG: hypothetical protein ABH837_01745 [bacterium]